MAGSRRMLPVADRTRWVRTATTGSVGTAVRSPAMPTSVSRISTPASRAIALVAAPPDITLATIAAVICDPYALTPSATTP
jgi:hypothetical protein